MLVWQNRFLSGILGTVTSLLMAGSAQATQQVYISLGLMEFSVSVSSLESYAKEGTITRELAAYRHYLTPQQQEQFRELLTTGSDLDAVAIAQFLYSPQGKTLLKQLGEIIDTKQRQGGFYAIRSALILAAADEGGLTLLNFLEHFPTQGLRINSNEGWQLFKEFTRLVRETEQAVAQIQRQAQAQSESFQGVTISNVPDLRQSGTQSYQHESLNLVDQREVFPTSTSEDRDSFSGDHRERQIPTELYLPQGEHQQKPPLIIISHGLGSNRHTYRYLAQHLASYGFAVALPEHSDSNAGYLQALLSGLEKEVSSPSELINRPLDIEYLLDYLERNYASKVNTQQVGLLGQSYGGYTTLALAGADIQYEAVTQRCQNHQRAAMLNVSLLLQCQLSRLPQQNYDFWDPRIQAVFAINPFASHIFGEAAMKGVKVPTLFVAGSADTIAPALTEQIRPFSWLDHPEKYLVLLQKGTHFSTIPEPQEEGIPIPSEVIGPDPTIARTYMKALSTAFFQTHLANKEHYQRYLTPEYTNQISRSLMPIFLVEQWSGSK